MLRLIGKMAENFSICWFWGRKKVDGWSSTLDYCVASNMWGNGNLSIKRRKTYFFENL